MARPLAGYSANAVTFTLPAELRPLAWANQRIVYAALMDCAWQTLREFALNHRHLHGTQPR